jgi:iron(III) transport system substrate-binding protein
MTHLPFISRRGVIAGAVGTALLPHGNVYASQAEWLKRARLAPNEPQDWKAIEAAARQEGKVVIYSVSSRITRLTKEFKDKYGVDIEAFDLPSNEQVEKFGREQKAGQFNVDVLYNNESPTMLAEFLPKKMVWNFVPDSVAPQLAANEKAPFLVQRWSSRVLIYNTRQHPNGPPFSNLWDLTLPEWKGRLHMPDPFDGGIQTTVMQTLIQQGDSFAKAHEAKFGRPVAFSPAVERAARAARSLQGKPNAAVEWWYRVMQNQPVYVGSTDKIFENVASVTQRGGAPVGYVTFSKLRDVKAGSFEARAAFEAAPLLGVAYPTALVIADRAPRPNAAKLLIRYMMEDGLKAWDVLGDYAARADMEASQATKFKIPAFDKSGLVIVDPMWVYNTRFDFVRLYTALR